MSGKKISIKLLSLLMSLVMIVTSIPLGAIATYAATTLKEPDRQLSYEKRYEEEKKKVSPETQAVYNYICEQYGKKLITGQQESTWVDNDPDWEMKYLENNTGRLPAIRGFDYIGSNVGETTAILTENDFEGVNKRAIEWWRKGGIVTICWHTGSNFIGGYQNSKKDDPPNWDKVLTDGTPENIEFKNQMAQGAKALQELRDAGVPVLWRPFHEFDGGWFWWGKFKKNATTWITGNWDIDNEKFKKLWIMMYDLYTNEYGLNNLIWVYGYSQVTSNPSALYPGDEYVDILGPDNYEKNIVTLFDKVNGVNVNGVNAKRPICLHECGTNPTEAQWNQAPYSYFMTWHTGWLTGSESNSSNTVDSLNQLYNSDLAITLDELPDFEHTHKAGRVEQQETKRATCTEEGSYNEITHCAYKNCEEIVSTEVKTIPALGHSFTNYVFDNNSNETFAGTKTAKCDRCDATNTVAFDPDADKEAIKDAMTAFEDKLKEGKVYTNLPDAYQAYVEASKAYDSFFYGGDTSIALATYAENLNNAVNSVKEASLQTPSASVVPAFSNGNVASGYYSNVLYSNGVSDNDKVLYFSQSNGGYDAKIHTNKTITLLYDGTKETSFPITLEAIKTKSSGWSPPAINVKTYAAYLKSNNDSTDKWSMTEAWLCEEKKWNEWPSKTTYTMSLSTAWPDNSAWSGGSHTFIFGNKLKYVGPADTKNYYETFNNSNGINIEHIMNGGYGSSKDVAWINRTANLPLFSTNANAGTVYVINYAPIPKAYSDNKEKLKNVKLYKQGGLQNIADAYSKAVSFNLNSYVNSSSNNVTGAAAQIKSIMASFNGTVKEDDPNQYPALRTVMDDTMATYKAGRTSEYSVKSYNAFKAAYEEAMGVMSQVVKRGYEDESLGDLAEAAATKLEAAYKALPLVRPCVTHTWKLINTTTPATCTKNGVGDFICTECEEPDSHEIKTPGHIHDRKYNLDKSKITEYCKVCKETFGVVDLTAYNAQVALANDALGRTEKYKDEDLSNLSTVLSKNVANIDSTQDEVDSYCAKIETAYKALELKEYSLTFIIMVGETEAKTETATYKYGDVVPLNVGSEYNPYKWTRAGYPSRIANATKEVSVVVYGETTVVAHCDNNAQAPAEQHKVTVYNKFNKPINYLYVGNNTKLTFNGANITVGEGKTAYTYTIEKIPFYQVTGYKAGSTQLDSSATYTVNGDIGIYPIYSAQQVINIELDKTNSNSNIRFSDDANALSKTVIWDQKITVEADQDVVWYVNKVAVAKGTSYTFRASNSIKISAQVVETEKGSTTITYADYDSENNKIRYAVSSYKSKDFVIAEQGIIVGTSTKSQARFNKDVIIKNGKKFVASKTTDTGDQFSYSISLGSSASIIKTICAVSYVKYKNIDTPIYSDINYIYLG